MWSIACPSHPLLLEVAVVGGVAVDVGVGLRPAAHSDERCMERVVPYPTATPRARRVAANGAGSGHRERGIVPLDLVEVYATGPVARRVAADGAGAVEGQVAADNEQPAAILGRVFTDRTVVIHRQDGVRSQIHAAATPTGAVAADGAGAVEGQAGALLHENPGTSIDAVVTADGAGVVHHERALAPYTAWVVTDRAGPIHREDALVLHAEVVVVADGAGVVHHERAFVPHAAATPAEGTFRVARDGARAVHPERALVPHATRPDPHEFAVVASDGAATVQREPARVEDSPYGVPRGVSRTAAHDDVTKHEAALVADTTAPSGLPAHDHEALHPHHGALANLDHAGGPADAGERGLAGASSADALDDEVLVDDRPATARPCDRKSVPRLGGPDRLLDRRVGLACVGVPHAARLGLGPRCRAGLQRQDEDEDEGRYDQRSDAAPHADPDDHRMAPYSK